MWGYQLFIDKKNHYQRVNIIKAKNNFLYANTKNKTKYFDFTSTINGGIFGYSHKFTTSKLKLAFSKLNQYLHSPKQVSSFLNPLYHHYPIFKEYHLYSLNNNQLWQWLGNNYHHKISQEIIEENNFSPLSFWGKYPQENTKPLIHWKTDLKLFYQNFENSAENTKNTPTSASSLKGLLLNSFFPHALHCFFNPSQEKQEISQEDSQRENYKILEALKTNFKKQEEFDFILYTGKIPFSQSNQTLLWSKQEQLSLPIISENQSITSLYYYKEIIKKALAKTHLKKETGIETDIENNNDFREKNHSLKQNRFNRKTKPLQQSLKILQEEISIIKKFKSIARIEGAGLFYKITLKDSLINNPTFNSLLQEYREQIKKANYHSQSYRIFIEDISLLCDGEKNFYLALPLYLEPHHLKNKLATAFQFIDTLFKL